MRGSQIRLIGAVVTVLSAAAGSAYAQAFESTVSGDVTITIADDIATVRGILVTQDVWADGFHGPNLHARMARTLGFAQMSVSGDTSPEGVYEDSRRGAKWSDTTLQAIAAIAEQSGYPELQNAPMIWTGFSDGGSGGVSLASYVPERFLAAANNDGGFLVIGEWANGDIDPQPFPLEMREIPLLFAARENYNYYEDFVNDNRAAGALFARASIHNRRNHVPEGRAWPVIFYFLSEVTKARYPTGATPSQYDDLSRCSVPLLTLDEQSGFVVTHDRQDPIQEIQWATDATSPRAGSWLLNENLAYAFRSLASWNRAGPVSIIGPALSFLDPGQTWRQTVSIDGSFADWERVTVYDGATKMAEFSAGETLSYVFTPSDGDVGLHLFSVVAERGNEQRVSPPSLVVVEGVAPFPFKPFPRATPSVPTEPYDPAVGPTNPAPANPAPANPAVGPTNPAPANPAPANPVPPDSALGSPVPSDPALGDPALGAPNSHASGAGPGSLVDPSAPDGGDAMANGCAVSGSHPANGQTWLTFLLMSLAVATCVSWRRTSTANERSPL